MAGSAGSFDLITMRRIGVDLHPDQSDVHLTRAIAAARPRHTNAAITGTDADPLGFYLHPQPGEFQVGHPW